MKNINWGTGIAILYISFVVGILALVTLTTTQRVDLVSEDYYALELDFQNKIDKTHRANTLAEPLRWQLTEKTLEVQFPKEFLRKDLAGKIRFYCPSDNTNDADFAIMPDARNQQRIALAKLQPGRYLLQFDWKNGETTYWNEGAIVVKNSERQ
ncbi:FixH family protein [Persicitalea jodogahamensis]|uniref:Cytochrome Cbb3 oxidase maturation protein CcoH n=1 Tax=Persicitalea jodogahamensis TaxID=402147 RepID=A0A8J3G9B1_9BACT|nr:FixH family protein [Persicitalea jodogahamensis]GHB71615.1 cytochrome Cbb3 oxidase maturation protein CcoH [Persicitalea jodogahamensis]